MHVLTVRTNFSVSLFKFFSAFTYLIYLTHNGKKKMRKIQPDNDSFQLQAIARTDLGRDQKGMTASGSSMWVVNIQLLELTIVTGILFFLGLR